MYPTLRAYLVLSLRDGQTKLDSELADSIRNFPSLLLDITAKTKTLELIKKLKPKESTKPEQILLKDELKELAKGLVFDGRAQVELRFHDLDYDLWRFHLFHDELFGKNALLEFEMILTPQSSPAANEAKAKITYGLRIS